MFVAGLLVPINHKYWHSAVCMCFFNVCK